MGNSDSRGADEPVARHREPLSSMRVLFLGDNEFPCAFQYTKAELSKYRQITVVSCTDENMISEVNRADVIVPCMTPITKGIIARAPHLKVICQFGHDVSGIDLDAAEAAGVLVTQVPSKDAGIAESCAEYALLMALNVLRRTHQTLTATKGFDYPLGRTICGMKAMVFGIGGIGQRLAVILQGLGVEALCVDTADPSQFVELPDADILFFCSRPRGITKSIVNANFLDRTKSGVYIINVSRAELIDYDDLYALLTQPGRIGGVGLEYFHKNSTHPLLTDPLVYLCPHVASATEVTYTCISKLLGANIIRILNGEDPMDVVVSSTKLEILDTPDDLQPQFSNENGDTITAEEAQ